LLIIACPAKHACVVSNQTIKGSVSVLRTYRIK